MPFFSILKKSSMGYRYMPAYPVKCLPSEMRSLFHNGATYLTGAVIFSDASILEKIAIHGRPPRPLTERQVPFFSIFARRISPSVLKDPDDA